jgi:hypothetical protein
MKTYCNCGSSKIWKNVEGKKYCKVCCSKLGFFKKLKKVSSKQKEINKEYSVNRRNFLEENPYCQAKLPGCTIYATDIHHKEGRGNNTNEVNTFMGLCRACHEYIHSNPIQARELGYLK